MNFAWALAEMSRGKVVRRQIWRNELVAFAQVPAAIESENTWNMKSLPGDMKVFLKQYKLPIYYKDQYIIYDALSNIATYCIFDGEDINAVDWMSIDPFNYEYE